MKILYLTAVLLIAVVLTEARSVKRLQKRQAYALPAGAELVVGDIKTTFSCTDKIYGYYADVDNNCQIFHVCLPVPIPGSQTTEMYTFSFFCGNQTVFDQETLVCVHPGDGIDCHDAPLFYIINENFGKNVWHTTPRPVPGYPKA